MKKIYLFLTALVSIVLIGCSSDDLQSITTPTVITDEETAEVPILFSSFRGNVTRGDITGADAAALLGNKFVVSGYKGSATAAAGSIVFDNYLVEYAENTAHTTQSNIRNWEYVGKGLIKHAQDHGITSQKIKYWDYTQPQYDFIAWSTGEKTAIYEGTPGDGKVLVSAITPTTKATKAYTFEGKAADLAQCYVSDLLTVKKTGTASENVAIGYGENPVTLKFRQLGTKVRIGLYETVPGYSVKDVKFYVKDGVLTDKEIQIVSKATIFTANADIYTEGKYEVSFPVVDKPDSKDNNQAHVKFTKKEGATQATTVGWGALDYTIREDGEKSAKKIYLGRSSNTATYAGDASKNYYEVYLPNETGTNLNLRVDYTLESTDGSGEVIEVKSSTAQVPSIYTAWKPGFAYTYLFKISDKTNGHTGIYDPTKPDDDEVNSDPAGLYPITFDAVVVNAEDNDATQETITTISTPSITTYQQGSTVVNADEYTANGNDIFVTVNENDALVNLIGKASLYTLPAGKTEAEVVNAFQMQDDDAAKGTVKGRSGLVLTKVTSNLGYAAKVEYGVDGNAITVGDNKSLRFTPTANTAYAFLYKKTAPTETTDRYEVLAWERFAMGATKYRYDYKATAATYTDDKGTTETTDDVTYYDAQKGVKYFKKDGQNYTMQTPFVGQDVSNLYLDDAGTTIATGNAQSGKTYYYTLNGQSYIAAHNVAYGSPKEAGLYVLSGDTYSIPTDETPQNGTAYYYKDGNNYIYCVFMPQQTNGWYELDTTKYAKATETAKVDGQTYFDKFTQNNGVYYTKIIKVQ